MKEESQVREWPPSSLRLRPLRAGDERAVHDAQQAMAADGFEFAFDLARDTDWSDYVDELSQLQRGIDVPTGRVPAGFFVATVGGVVVGRASIRFELDGWLREFGGHIGYGVLPPFRRRGFATEILRQSLTIVRAFGVDRVLLTCDDENLASLAVIERCGGLLDPHESLTAEEVPKRRYWIA